MKKSSGFTLVELLAVIVILAIILAIAIPGITTIIESAQVNAFKNNEQLLLKAAKTYVGVNDNYLPANIGETSEITLSTLQTDSYIGTIKAPDDKSKTCNGYVIIANIDGSNYSYTPYLNCENNIGNSAQNGLVFNYKFDDFQNPTINLMKINSYSPTAVNDSTAGCNLTVVPYVYNGISGYRVTKTINGGWGSFLQWNMTVPNLKIGRNYTFSIYTASLNGNTVDISNMFSQGNSLNKPWNNYNIMSTTQLSRLVFNTQTVLSSYDETVPNGQTTWHCNFTSTNIDIFIANPQLEEKDYATPFINGTRNGIVTDNSGSGNNTTLALNNSPKWTENSKVGEGAYQFDGVNDYINTSAKITSKAFTLSTWIKANNYTAPESWIIGQYGDGQNPGRMIFNLNSDGTLRLFMNGLAVYGSIIAKNKWYHVVAVRREDGTGLTYIDGTLNATGNISNIDIYNVPISIGSRSDTNTNNFDGYIDNVRVYNRALSNEEIKQIYNSER